MPQSSPWDCSRVGHLKLVFVFERIQLGTDFACFRETLPLVVSAREGKARQSHQDLAVELSHLQTQVLCQVPACASSRPLESYAAEVQSIGSHLCEVRASPIAF